MKKVNAGYEIIETLIFSKNHYVLGHNPSAPAAYVTWEADENKDNFYRGHYFTQKESALLDMFKRAGQELHLEGGKSLGTALLTQQDRQDLFLEFQNENARQDIAAALYEELENRDAAYNAESLLQDPSFMKQAMHLYDNIDHSHENETLRDNLASLLDEFPQYQIQPMRAELRIAPEMNALVKDLLSMPTADILKKYGPLGDNIQFKFALEDGKTANFEIVPAYDGQDPATSVLSKTKPHSVAVTVWDENGFIILSQSIQSDAFRESGLTGGYTISPNEGEPITLVLQEDEALRRIGNQFTYRANTEQELYQEHDGEICTIQRALTTEEYDILCTGFMWEAEFPNRERLHVFDDELTALEQENTRKPPLTQQISSAQDKVSHLSPAEKTKLER